MRNKHRPPTSGFRVKPSNGAGLLEPGPAGGPCELCDVPDGHRGSRTALAVMISDALARRGVVNICTACVARFKLLKSYPNSEEPMSDPTKAPTTREIVVAMTMADAGALGRMLVEYSKKAPPVKVQFIDPQGNRIVFDLSANPPKDAKVIGKIEPVEPPPEGSARP